HDSTNQSRQPTGPRGGLPGRDAFIGSPAVELRVRRERIAPKNCPFWEKDMQLFVIPLALLTSAAPTFAADEKVPAADKNLPAPPDVSEMVVVALRNNPKDDMRVAAPASHIPNIWAKLQPAAVDNSPARWESMGYDLELTLKNRRKLRVWVFTRRSAPGVF